MERFLLLISVTISSCLFGFISQPLLKWKHSTISYCSKISLFSQCFSQHVSSYLHHWFATVTSTTAAVSESMCKRMFIFTSQDIADNNVFYGLLLQCSSEKWICLNSNTNSLGLPIKVQNLSTVSSQVSAVYTDSSAPVANWVSRA